MTASSEAFELEVNGERHHVVGGLVTLLEVLRDQLGLTGTKFNCEQGECGACTVLVDGQAVVACLALAPALTGTAIMTIEGIGPRSPTDIQRRFMDCDALQCGYCTPGMIMSAQALLAWDEDRSPAALKAALSGNYCRCTGYETIVEALQSLLDREAE